MSDERVTNAIARLRAEPDRAPRDDQHRHAARRSNPDLASSTNLETLGLELIAISIPSCLTPVALISGTSRPTSRRGGQKAVGEREKVSGKDLLRRVVDDVREAKAGTETPSLAQVEAEHIARVLHDCAGNISEAARRLGIYRSSLQRKLRKRDPGME